MREVTVKNLTTREKYEVCILINEDAACGVVATLQTLRYFASDYVRSLVKEEAKECASMKDIEDKLYNS